MSMIEHMQLDLIEDEENIAIINQSPMQEVTETNLDLENYINNYKDFAKYLRLIFISRRCRPLRLEALIMALQWLKTTWNFVEYCKVFNIISIVVREDRENADNALAILNPGVCCREDFNFQRFQTRISYDPIHLPDGHVLEFDSEWVDRTRRLSNQTLDKLDTDLKNYKANNMAESIRRGCDELACVNLDCGDLLSANKNYTRSRDYCKTDAHELSMAVNVIRVSVYLGHWRHVASYVDRAETLLDNLSTGTANATSNSVQKSSSGIGISGSNSSLASSLGGLSNATTSTGTMISDSSSSTIIKPIDSKLTTDQKEIRLKMRSFLHCVVGLLEMHEGNYQGAARAFLQADHDHMVDNRILTANDVALYGTMCSLAKFDRASLKTNVIQNTNFKMFLENEPTLRDILFSFYNFQYADCLRNMAQIKSQLLLDIYLADHVEYLYREIRNRALCQYFNPYKRAHLSRIAECFNTTVPELVQELKPLISNGQLKAKIDSQSGLLVACSVSQKTQVFRRAFHLFDSYERRIRATLVQNACVRSEIYQNSSTQNYGDVQMDCS